MVSNKDMNRTSTTIILPIWLHQAVKMYQAALLPYRRVTLRDMVEQALIKTLTEAGKDPEQRALLPEGFWSRLKEYSE